MPPPYDMSDAPQTQARENVEQLIQRLHPGALDGNSREVLHNLVNDWTDQEASRLSGDRVEWKAVSGILVGLAREEAARRQPRYADDYLRARQALHALALTYRQLTGEELAELPSPHPSYPASEPVRSTFGPLILPEDERVRAAASPDPASPDPASTDPARPSVNGHGRHVPADTGDRTEGE
jgi:hypothetical protein